MARDNLYRRIRMDVDDRVAPNWGQADSPPPFMRKKKVRKLRNAGIAAGSTSSLVRQNVASVRTESRPGILFSLRVLLCVAALGVLLLLWPSLEQMLGEAALPEVLYSTESLPENQSWDPAEDRLIVAAPEIESPKTSTIVHTVKRGDTLSSIFSSYGLPQSDASVVYHELKSIGKKEKLSTSIKGGQKLKLELAADGSLAELRTGAGPGQSIVVERNGVKKDNNLEGENLENVKPKNDEVVSFTARLKEKPRHDVERVSRGVIKTSFAAAAEQAGMSYALVDDFVDLFGDRVVFHRDLRLNDSFSVIYQTQVLSDGTDVTAGEIGAASLHVNGTRHIAVRFIGSDGKARYYNEKGEILGNFFLRYPLKYSRISSHFTHARLHPVLKRRMPHLGVDFAAPLGTAVRTVADGQVLFAGRKGPNGIMVKIRHGARYDTAYLHLSKLGSGVRRGALVKRGQVIGNVGSTGRSTGPHLDYRFYDNGKSVDPLKIKLPVLDSDNKAAKIDKAFLAQTIYTLDQYEAEQLDDDASTVEIDAASVGPAFMNSARRESELAKSKA